jgi:hypothetical protein
MKEDEGGRRRMKEEDEECKADLGRGRENKG